MPGEKRTINIRYAPEAVNGGSAVVHVSGWNIEPVVVDPAASKANAIKAAQHSRYNR